MIKYESKPWFSRKEKRAYRQILDGIKKSKIVKKPLRFLTLTSNDLVKEISGKGILNDDFKKFVQIVRRTSPLKLLEMGYMTERQLVDKYGKDKSVWSVTFNFEYFKVRVDEANGVIHCLFRGPYLPYQFISDVWKDVHYGSWEVNIQFVDDLNKNARRTSSYIVGQYMTGQSNDGYIKTFYGSSSNWIFKGAVKTYREFITSCRERFFYNPIVRRYYSKRQEVDIFKLWDEILEKRIILQSVLTDYG